jgi:transposase
MHLIETVGATPYIPFRDNSTDGTGLGHQKPDQLWTRLWHFYNFNRIDFMTHYHKRSNVETAFSMIKMKFGGSVRSKSGIAQVNEVLCKIVCHNICVLIQSMHELGISVNLHKECVIK